MKNLLNMSDSDEDEEAADRKIKKLKRQTKKDDEDSEGDSDEEEPAIVNRGKKIQIDSEDIRKDREKEKKRRIDNEKKKQDQQKQVSLFLGESQGHYKMGVFVRIELQIQKKFSRMLVPEYPVILQSLRHQELAYSFIRVKIKKHRWYPHI
jgi:ribosome biogenesis protein BMS1